MGSRDVIYNIFIPYESVFDPLRRDVAVYGEMEDHDT